MRVSDNKINGFKKNFFSKAPENSLCTLQLVFEVIDIHSLKIYDLFFLQIKGINLLHISPTQNDFFTALLNNIVTYVAVLETDGSILFCNNTHSIIDGLKREDIIAKKLYDVPGFVEIRERIKSDVELCAQGEGTFQEISFPGADGGVEWMAFSMHPIFDDQGMVKYLVPEARNITEYKKKEELLKSSQKMAALDKSFDNIAHDYNNILSIIKGFTELLSDNLADDSRLKEYTRQIKKATERGVVLTQKLMTSNKQKRSENQVNNFNEQLMTGSPLKGITVLAADDEGLNRIIIKEMLGSKGANVILAESGQQALDYVAAQTNTIDVVLMDVMMQGMGGNETTRKIHKMMPQLPVIGLTGQLKEQEHQLCYNAGMVEIILKPFSCDDLLKAIVRQLK